METRSGDYIAYMCPTHSTTETIGCQQQEKKVYIRYETANVNVAVSFTLHLTSKY